MLLDLEMPRPPWVAGTEKVRRNAMRGAIRAPQLVQELREMPDEGVIEKLSPLHGTAYCQSLNCEYALSG
jgi:hypothetical protein